MILEDYLTPKEAAKEIGISYYLLMARIRKGRIPIQKKGWATFIHKREVTKEKVAEAERKKTKGSQSKI